MPRLEEEEPAEAHGDVDPPGFKGSRSTGFVCLECGAQVKGGIDRWWQLHTAWHQQHGG